MFQRLEVSARIGNQAALHAQIADGVLQLGNGRFKRSLRGGYIGLDPADIGLDVPDLASNGPNIFFLLLGLGRDARGCDLLLALQLGSACGQFFFSQADLLRQVSGVGFGGCIRLVRSPISSGWNSSWVTFASFAVLVVDEKRGRGHIGDREHDQNPFARVALRAPA